jgi:hypothetical protein
MSVYLLSASGSSVTIQDIGLVVPNSVGTVTALNDGAEGDIILVK